MVIFYQSIRQISKFVNINHSITHSHNQDYTPCPVEMPSDSQRLYLILGQERVNEVSPWSNPSQKQVFLVKLHSLLVSFQSCKWPGHLPWTLPGSPQTLSNASSAWVVCWAARSRLCTWDLKTLSKGSPHLFPSSFGDRCSFSSGSSVLNIVSFSCCFRCKVTLSSSL